MNWIEKKTDREISQELTDRLKHEQEYKPRLSIAGTEFQDEHYDNSPFPVTVVGKEPSLVMCQKCKEWTFVGGLIESCCGDECAKEN
jgi:hypothetical protein